MTQDPAKVFTREWTQTQFPPERTDAFFDALFGDAEEGAYTIELVYVKSVGNSHEFAFELHQRPGHCLVCSLTFGLPQVFSRHPIINVKGIAEAVAKAVQADEKSVTWNLGATREHSTALHTIPLIVSV